jgi:hypothetical protein
MATRIVDDSKPAGDSFLQRSQVLFAKAPQKQ